MNEKKLSFRNGETGTLDILDCNKAVDLEVLKQKYKNSYILAASIGTFADELAFKKKLVKLLKEDKNGFKDVIEIENSVEPGMPDIITIDIFDRVVFIEIKYARKGVITFKRSQLPWYRRHPDLIITIVAYNDKTKNLHTISAKHILKNTTTTSFKLREETV